jgi:hypothetical protein
MAHEAIIGVVVNLACYDVSSRIILFSAHADCR